MDWSPDGRVLATSDSLRRVRLWDLLTGREILSIDGLDELKLKGLEPPDVQLTFSADGRNIAANLHGAGEVYICSGSGLQPTEKPEESSKASK